MTVKFIVVLPSNLNPRTTISYTGVHHVEASSRGVALAWGRSRDRLAIVCESFPDDERRYGPAKTIGEVQP